MLIAGDVTRNESQNSTNSFAGRVVDCNSLRVGAREPGLAFRTLRTGGSIETVLTLRPRITFWPHCSDRHIEIRLLSPDLHLQQVGAGNRKNARGHLNEQELV